MSKKLRFKTIMILLIFSSGVLSLLGDLIYGSKPGAEEYLFGGFIISLSGVAFVLFHIMLLFSLILLLIKKLNPIILEKIKFEDDAQEKEKAQ